MWLSLMLYAGVVVAALGILFLLRPMPRLGVPTRKRAAVVAATGVAMAVMALTFPVSDSRAEPAVTHLDKFAPVWQFREIHSLEVDAAPARVYSAVKQVRADEITFFHTLTSIRRGGREAPEGLLNAGSREPLLDIATKSGFVMLADDPARELVIGAVVVAPPGTGGTLTPAVFQTTLPPGFALATMNFRITPVGTDRSLVSTETRVYANDADSRRRFARYWRVIYPGSAIIRRMWLRAIARRATIAIRIECRGTHL